MATGVGVLNCLEAIRLSGFHTRFYQASTSELYGGQRGEVFCNEETPFHPRSAYGISKVAGFDLTRNYREAYDLYAVNGICYNHESPRRGFEFVTRKITSHVAMIKLGIVDKLELGDMSSKRDWGHAREYVEAMWLMLQQNEPKDYVIGTGESYSVKDFCEKAFSYAGLDYNDYVKTNKTFLRPSEVDLLMADPSKAKRELNWQYKLKIDDLIKEMVDSDLKYFESREKK